MRFTVNTWFYRSYMHILAMDRQKRVIFAHHFRDKRQWYSRLEQIFACLALK